MSVEATLEQFKETEGAEPFQLQGSKMLKVKLADETIQAKLGSMGRLPGRRQVRARRLGRPEADGEEGGHRRGRRPDEDLRER
jgi:hypothetical protein